jgi:hypothetical protein
MLEGCRAEIYRKTIGNDQISYHKEKDIGFCVYFCRLKMFVEAEYRSVRMMKSQL